MPYQLSQRAEEDILAILVEGFVRFGEKQVEQYIRVIENTLDFLGENPKAARERDEISPPVRIYPFGSHLVVYTIQSNGDILVLRIRHAREDWANDE